MAANGIAFSDYSKHPKPRRCYIDSSFVVHLLNFSLTKAGATPTPKDASCDAFHKQLLFDGVELVASVITYAELVNFYCFKYPGGMYDVARNFLKNPALSGEKALKDFFKQSRSGCEAAWAKINYRVQAAEYLFSNRQIRLAYPLGTFPQLDRTMDIVMYATILQDAFVGIGSSDSAHLSIASSLNADAVVSMDKGFLTVDGFTIYFN
jgi:hypothetical protein